MKNVLAPGKAILVSLLVAALILSITACGKDEAKTPATASPTSSFTFQNETLSFDYGPEWRLSGKTDSSIVLTHKDRPGDVLLSAQWFTSEIADGTQILQLYRNQLGLLATEVQRLEDITVGSINAECYASLISKGDERSVISLHVLFNSGSTFYLVTFNATPEDFVAYTSSANQVIDTIRVR